MALGTVSRHFLKSPGKFLQGRTLHESHCWPGNRLSDTNEEVLVLVWIKVFLLVANSTGLRQGHSTKVQTEIKLVWEDLSVGGCGCGCGGGLGGLLYTE